MQEEQKRITVKVNGKDKLVTEIRKEPEVAAALDNDLKDESFQWVLPEENEKSNLIHFSERHFDKNDYEYNSSFNKDRTPGLPIHRKKKKMPFPKSKRSPNFLNDIPKKIFIPIVGAVIVGSLIGIIVLMIFTGEEFESKNQIVSPVDSSTSESDDVVNKGTMGEGIINLSLNTFIVQGGVFSTKENADVMVDTIQNSGHAAAYGVEENRVFIGIAPSLDRAHELANEYKSLVPDAYPKEWQISANQVPVPENNDLSWVSEGRDLFKSFINTKPSVIEQSSDKIDRWKKEALQSIEKLPDENKEKGVAFVTSLTALPDKADSTWTYQQGLLDVFIAYKGFVSELHD